MTFAPDNQSAGPVGMTLAAVAYAPGRAAIEQKLADPALPTGGHWFLDWYGVDDANQVFVARDRVTGQQAVAIRGSVVDPLEAHQCLAAARAHVGDGQGFFSMADSGLSCPRRAGLTSVPPKLSGVRE